MPNPTQQLPISRWHEQIGEPTLAEGILDRLVHNANRIQMRGTFMTPSAQIHDGSLVLLAP